MQLSDMNGKEIAKVFWVKHAPEGDDFETFEPKPNERAYFSSEYYGNHTENWIVVEEVATGKEIMRYNAANTDSIEWKDSE